MIDTHAIQLVLTSMRLEDAVCSDEKREQYVIRELLASSVESVRVMSNDPSALSAVAHRFLLRHVEQNGLITALFAHKSHLFLIQSLERSENARPEHESAFRLVNAFTEVSLIHLLHVQKYPSLIPPSLMRSLIAIASDPTDSLFRAALHTLLRLLIHSPQLFISCDGVSCLLNGCTLTHDTSLLQSALLTCLYFVNDKTYRQSKLLLDMQVIIDPLLSDATLSTAQGYDESLLYTSPNVAVLTVLRSWNGLLIAGSDFNSFRNYINVLTIRSEDDPQLVIAILCNLFSLFGVPPPNLLNEEDPIKQSLFWTQCSIFLDRVGLNPSLRAAPRTNLLTTYLSVLVMTSLRAKLPETLVPLLKSANSQIAFLSRCLLMVLSLLSNLFVSSAHNTCYQSLSKSLLLSLKETSHSALPYSIIAIDSNILYLYPIIQHSVCAQSELVDYASWIVLFHTIIDSFCDNQRASQPFSITDTLCKHHLINQETLSRTLGTLFKNRHYFTILLRHINVGLDSPRHR